jgi:hypothetical protein
MILKEGDKVLIAHRRLFPHDEPRFFVGTVEAYEAGVVKVRGRSFIRNLFTGVVEKRDTRTKLISLSSGTLIVYLLPDHVLLDSVEFRLEDGWLLLSDGRDFNMNLAERTIRRREMPVLPEAEEPVSP